MKRYSRTHVADRPLLDQTRDRVTRQCEDTAELLADLAEIDERKLYLSEGYDSMLRFCIGEYGFSEDMAYQRIQVARAARQYPAIFDAVAAGRTNLSAARLLVPHLTRENVDELLAAANRKTNAEIQVLLARRVPEGDLGSEQQLAAMSKGELAVRQVGSLDLQRVTGQFVECAHGTAQDVAPRPKRMELRLQISAEAYEELQYAKELLGHAVPTGEMGEVFQRAVRALIETLERKRFAATSRMSTRRSRGLGRYVPADVRRAVVKRDGGQCTYVSETGHRCASRMRLEFDHVTPVAQGGRSSVDGVRLLCRAHNQLAAEKAFGKDFMDAKREAARERGRRSAAGRLEQAIAQAADEGANPDTDSEITKDVIAGLRSLGFSEMRARFGVAACTAIPGASLEDRLRDALRTLAPRGDRRPAPMAGCENRRRAVRERPLTPDCGTPAARPRPARGGRSA